ncbi:MAG: hypothetical protein IPK13_18610 [Deltaproteobacteria bacterium]|nr:hypothetical protein [Deltaproteobacteria bacterium]
MAKDTQETSFHEDFSRLEAVEGSSNRSFGIVFTVFFLIVGTLPLLGGGGVRVWALGVSAAFFVVAMAAPKVLAPLNAMWMKFGLVLHRIVSPVVLGLLFFLTMTPIALFLRATGKDLLRLRLDPSAKTYWIERDPPGPPPETMTNQF